jgi:phosphoglycerate dehydrogenase-like enzyme
MLRMQMLISQSVPLEFADFPLDVVRFDPKGNLDHDAEMVVVWNLSPRVLEPLIAMPRLRLIQTLTAGVDHVLRLEPRTEIVLCNGKGLHDDPTAELAVSLLLSGVRRLHHFRDLQQLHQWDKTAYAHALSGQDFLSLESARILVVGFGSIGAEIAKRLTPFGCVVEGVAQSGGVRHGYIVHPLETLDSLLPKFDAVILVLPDTPETHGFVSSQRLERMKRGAWLVNVGRGSAVVETDLVAALESGHLGGAALDVTHSEPLPEDSKLWGCKNLILTPHIAGGGPNFYRKAEALLRRNASNLLLGQPLENVITRAKGY